MIGKRIPQQIITTLTAAELRSIHEQISVELRWRGTEESVTYATDSKYRKVSMLLPGLRREMERQGMSAKELASRAGVQPSTVEVAMYSQRHTQPAKARSIAAALGVPLKQLREQPSSITNQHQRGAA